MCKQTKRKNEKELSFYFCPLREQVLAFVCNYAFHQLFDRGVFRFVVFLFHLFNERKNNEKYNLFSSIFLT